MVKVAISEFRAHMSKYLMYVLEGQEILLTSRGKEIAELRQPVNRQEVAREKLARIAATAEVNDVVSPVIDELGVTR
ncbi:MAG: type II toxin-antitoxin system prevent-host-death family antitoxin [Candidatus Electrothrix sp. AR4]|nr:type II toxin-antitoxin system prevent-host-death family antitoxin [Candidatus Electrothrix sp. AR4]